MTNSHKTFRNPPSRTRLCFATPTAAIDRDVLVAAAQQWSKIMSHAIIGMFDTATAADQARATLVAMGIKDSAIHSSGSDAVSASSGTSTHQYGSNDKGFWESIKEMFGADDSDENDRYMSYYSEGARRGSVILSVEADEDEADEVANAMKSAGAIDVDAKAAEWGKSGWAGYSAENSTATQGTAAPSNTNATAASSGAASGASGKIDLVKEDLALGKRVVNRGGVRVIKRVIETPVEKDINLSEEHVSVARRVVDRPLTDADATTAFKDQTIELTESAEEAVAAKTARVVGEVIVGKTVKERTEKVRDTLKETDVQVEQLAGSSGSSTGSNTTEKKQSSGR